MRTLYREQATRAPNRVVNVGLRTIGQREPFGNDADSKSLDAVRNAGDVSVRSRSLEQRLGRVQQWRLATVRSRGTVAAIGPRDPKSALNREDPGAWYEAVCWLEPAAAAPRRRYADRARCVCPDAMSASPLTRSVGIAS